MATTLPGSPPSFDRNDVNGTVKSLCNYTRNLQENLDFMLGQLQKSMNRPDLKTDPDFATLPMRSKNHEKVEQIITDWLMTFDDTREAYEMMEKAGVAVAPVMTAEEVWEDEEYNRLGWWVNFPMYPEWEGTDIISNKHCAYFADFSTIDEHPENRPANISTRIGENNYEVLKEWGKTEEEAKALLEKWGAINI